MALDILEKGCTFVDRRRILTQAATGFWFDLILVCTNNKLDHIFKILHHQILDSLKRRAAFVDPKERRMGQSPGDKILATRFR
jgi:hypothetical protein